MNLGEPDESEPQHQKQEHVASPDKSRQRADRK